MPVMMSKLYAALRAGNVPDDKAQEAAEEVAGFENRLASVDARLLLLTWMTGANTAILIALLGIVLRR
jgi:hypothetical protein